MYHHQKSSSYQRPEDIPKTEYQYDGKYLEAYQRRDRRELQNGQEHYRGDRRRQEEQRNIQQLNR